MVLHTGDKDWNDKKHGVVACKQHSVIGKVVDQVTVQVLVTVLWHVVECAAVCGISNNRHKKQECPATTKNVGQEDCLCVGKWHCGSVANVLVVEVQC